MTMVIVIAHTMTFSPQVMSGDSGGRDQCLEGEQTVVSLDSQPLVGRRRPTVNKGWLCPHPHKKPPHGPLGARDH